MRFSRRSLLPVALAVAGPLLVGPSVATPAAAASPPRYVAYHQWATGTQLSAGTSDHVVVDRGRLLLAAPTAVRTYGGRRYQTGSWRSPWVSPGFALTELVPSWQATTPKGTWIQVEVRGIGESGTTSSWDTIAQWAGGDSTIERRTMGPQTDDLARVDADTWEAQYGGAFTSWQLRLRLYRAVGSTATPVVETVGAMVSALPAVDSVTTSAPGPGRGITLPVPRYSQMIHEGEYPQYDGGGEAWCSPTSVTMVLAYYPALPTARETAWVNDSYADPEVDNAAWGVYDYGYDGTGTWPFNTAYAANHAGHAFVTRFRSLGGVERMIAAGIPVVTSLRFAKGELHNVPAATANGSNGHLVVVVDFTAAGDVVVNDPAAATRKGVRRVYDRGEFEDAWLKRYPSGGSMKGSGGLAYVIRDDAHPLPARHGSTAW
ncbi:MAG: C39 family peptidase [Nocardioidaceae bacterium]